MDDDDDDRDDDSGSGVGDHDNGDPGRALEGPCCPHVTMH